MFPIADDGDGIYKLVKNRAIKAGIAPSFSPHDFRRTFGSDLLEAGEDVFTVQDLLLSCLDRYHQTL